MLCMASDLVLGKSAQAEVVQLNVPNIPVLCRHDHSFGDRTVCLLPSVCMKRLPNIRLGNLHQDVPTLSVYCADRSRVLAGWLAALFPSREECFSGRLGAVSCALPDTHPFGSLAYRGEGAARQLSQHEFIATGFVKPPNNCILGVAPALCLAPASILTHDPDPAESGQPAPGARRSRTRRRET